MLTFTAQYLRLSHFICLKGLWTLTPRWVLKKVPYKYKPDSYVLTPASWDSQLNSPLWERYLLSRTNGCNCFFRDVTTFWRSQQNRALAMIVGNFCRAHKKIMKEGKWTRATLKVEAYIRRDWRKGTVNSGQSPSHHLRCLPCTRINTDVRN